MTTTTRADRIDRIVSLSPARYRRERAIRRAARDRAYHAYAGDSGVRPIGDGSPLLAGHGSWACDLNRDGVQDRWREAEATLADLIRIYDDPRAWTHAVRGGDHVYTYVSDPRRHEIAIASHGVDIDGIDLPSRAIEAVRAALMIPGEAE